MAKTATKPAAKAKGKEVATTKSTAVAKSSVDVSLLREQDSGFGISTDPADHVVPLIYVLQSLSPVCLKQKPEYIKGAEAGMFWPRGSKELWDGDEGLLVVPCHYDRFWMEWKPDRGGLVGRHEGDEKTPPVGAEQVADPKNPKRKVWKMGENSLVFTRQFAMLILNKGDTPRAGVLSFTSSNHAAARNWNTELAKKKTPKGNKASLFEYIWKITTIAKSNDLGDWYGLAVDETEDRTPDDIYVMARDVAIGFSKGELRAAEMEESEIGGEGGESSSEVM